MDMFKNFVDVAKKKVQSTSVPLSQVRQKTGEILGTAERTQYDAQFEDLFNKCLNIKKAVRSIMSDLRPLSLPNLQTEKRINPRSLSASFMQISRVLPSTNTVCGEISAAELGLAEIEQKMVQKIHGDFYASLEKFVKNFEEVENARRNLEHLRLSYDAARNGNSSSTELRDFKIAFETAMEETSDKMLEFTAKGECMGDTFLQLIQAQFNYHTESAMLLGSLVTGLMSGGEKIIKSESTWVQVIFEYEAKNMNELSIQSDEVLRAESLVEVNGMIKVRRGTCVGLVPVSCIKPII